MRKGGVKKYVKKMVKEYVDKIKENNRNKVFDKTNFITIGNFENIFDSYNKIKECCKSKGDNIGYKIVKIHHFCEDISHYTSKDVSCRPS